MKQVINNVSEKIKVRWIKSSNMLSDSLTKDGASSMKLCNVLENDFIDIRELEKDEEEKQGLPQ